MNAWMQAGKTLTKGVDKKMAQSESRQKLGELMLYIASKMQDSAAFGAVKLNKVLFYSDFLWYRNHGESITGAVYRKLDRGPSPRSLLSVQRSLENEGSAELIHRKTPVGVQKRLVPKREADLSGFTSAEIALVDGVIDWLTNHSANDVSSMSHQHLGWRLAEYDEDIPYFTAHLADRGAMPSDVKRGSELAREFGWFKDSTIAP